MAETSLLPLGQSSFKTLRDAGLIYVDKTDLVASIAKMRSPFFLSRPRRFGKSLLLSTFESLFKDGTKYFQGLKLESLWQEDKTYRVLKIDFSGEMGSETPVAELDRVLRDKIRDFAALHGVTFQDNWSDYTAAQLLERVAQECWGELVLLVDEYDYALSHALGNKPRFEAFRSYLQNFFGKVKECQGAFRFIFITGISRFSHTSIFSQLNNLDDLSLNGAYATLLGYTGAELREYFDEYVADAAVQLACTKDLIYEGLRLNYDSFRLSDESEDQVYNPWSILNFMRYPKRGYRSYWYESGGLFPTLVIKYLRHALAKEQAQAPEAGQVPTEPYRRLESLPFDRRQLSVSYDYFEIPPAVLLFQTGYLTIREVPDADGVPMLRLMPPNLEVNSNLAALYLEEVRDKPIDVDVINACQSAARFFAQEDLGKIRVIFNHALNSFGYDAAVLFKYEAMCRDVIRLVLTLSALSAKAEVISAQGRCDLVVETPALRYVFEFKLARTKTEAAEAAALEDAVSQLKDQRYGEILPVKRLIKVAVVISTPKREIVKFETVVA
ncbi:MAG: AAA family ATPase [Succinivibrio sp.]|nr:AAA family ATPase [Succinivibrio sp.]